MAQLAAWIPLVYLDKLFALPSQLIFQHVREQIPAIVSYGFAKTELATLFPLCHRPSSSAGRPGRAAAARSAEWGTARVYSKAFHPELFRIL